MARAAVSVREITAILVSWKDGEELIAAVAALAAARGRIAPGGVSVSLVVVDNGGGLSEEAVRDAWPDATVLVNAVNRGFGPAANQAAAAGRGDVLLFLNPDTRAEGEPFSAIARALEPTRAWRPSRRAWWRWTAAPRPPGPCVSRRPAARTRRRSSCAACRRSSPTPAS